MVKDLTTGSPVKALVLFSIPMVVATVFQQLYNLADSIIAGRVLGVDALSATSVSYPVTLIYVAVAQGCANGAAVVIANLMGRRRYTDMKSAISTTVISMLAIGVVLTVVGEVFCSGILGLLNTDASIFTDSYTYLQIYTFGVIFVLLYNAATAAFNAMGDSRTPLILLIFSSVINVVLDIVFTLDACGVRLGVAGLAWATFVAQGAACVAALIWMALRLSRIREDSEQDEDALAAIRNSTAPHAHHRLHLPHPTFKLFSAHQLRSILPIALPSVVQQIFVPLGLLFVQSIVNGFASPVIAGYTSAVKVNTLCVSCNTMFSNAVSAYSAQNRGAGKEDRVVRGLKASVVVAIIIAAVFTALSFFCSEQLIDLFASEGDAQHADMVDAGSLFLTITSPFYVIVGVELVFNGLHRGTRHMIFFMSSTIADLVLRVVLAFVLAPVLGYAGIGWAYSFSWCMGLAVAFGCFLTGRWKKKIETE